MIWIQGKGLGLPAYAAWTRASARRWPELATRLREDAGIDVALAQPGGVHLCLSERELAARAELVARLLAQSAREQYRFEIIDRAALARLLPGIGHDVAGASYCPEDGHVNPLKLLRALHAGFTARGGHSLSARAARTITRTADGFALATAQGTVVAARVVLAAGLGNAALAPQGAAGAFWTSPTGRRNAFACRTATRSSAVARK